jgi:hypothetical protein
MRPTSRASDRVKPISDCFGGGVNGKTAIAGEADNRGDVHDPPAAIGHHGTHYVLGEDDGGDRVQAHQLLDPRVGHQRESAVVTHTRVVYQPVDRAEVLPQRLDEAGNVFGLSQIEGDKMEGSGAVAFRFLASPK